MGIRDKRKTRSKLIAYRASETSKERHVRRLEFNLKAEEWAREQAIAIGLTLTLANNGQHWLFRSNDHKFKADWWPSSAKLVLNARYGNGIHVHDYEAAMDEIRKGLHAFGKTDPSKRHHCFHCSKSKPPAQFRSAGCTWCKQCEAQ